MLNRRRFAASCGGLAAGSLLASARCFGASELRDLNAISQDPLRPQYHLLPAANWMNDPNGPVYWNGNYHVFYQYNPNAAKWGDMHWAHALSADMIHWRHLPIALSPDPHGPDRDGCFSGSTVIQNGVPTILYTGVTSTSPEKATLRDGVHDFCESQCMATSQDPRLRSWNQSPNPVIASPPSGLNVTGFRDPCVWTDGSWWYMGIGSGISKQGGCVLLYRSHDLRNWDYLHPLVSGRWNGTSNTNPVDTGEMWECPDFFELDGKHVLLYSTERKVFWSVGELDRDGMVFHPKSQGLLDTGAFYAPKTMLDGRGRRILWGWIPETRSEAEYEKAGWAGSMGLPRILSIGSSGTLRIEPLPELHSLRTQHQSKNRWFNSFRGEVIANFSGPGLIQVGPAKKPYVTVAYSGSSSMKIFIDGKDQAISPAPEADVPIQIYMDGSIVEVFINGTAAHTKRVYELDYTLPATSVSFVGDVRSLRVFELAPISRDRLTT